MLRMIEAVPRRDPALRQRAEDFIGSTPTATGSSAKALVALPEQLLLHEVQVHQIELEMQNEELLRAQIQLDAAKARYFDLYDLAPIGYCTLNDHGVVLEANLAAATLLGVHRSVLASKPLSRFIARASQDQYYLCMNAITATGLTQDCELQVTTQNNDPKADPQALAPWVQMRMSAVQVSNGTTALRVVFHDISERKRLEAETQAKSAELERAWHAAERANRAKSEFLSSMTHELRSPLNAILGFAQLLDMGKTPLTNTQKGNIDQIVHAGWYLLDLVNKVLDLSLVESGKLAVTLTPVQLADVLLDCQAMMGPLAQKRGIQVHFTMPPPDWALLADATRLKQVCVNLISNAIQYNRDQGKVDVTCALRAPGRIRISVADTGLGLSADQLGQLFQPFNRLGRESKDQDGTGIGLAISKHLVELMGGSIGAESRAGIGSTFWFELVVPASTTPRPDASP